MLRIVAEIRLCTIPQIPPFIYELYHLLYYSVLSYKQLWTVKKGNHSLIDHESY